MLSKQVILLLDLLIIQQLNQLPLLLHLTRPFNNLRYICISHLLLYLPHQLLLLLYYLRLPHDPIPLVSLKHPLKRPVSLILNRREIQQRLLLRRLQYQLIESLLVFNQLLILLLAPLDSHVILPCSHYPQKLIGFIIVPLQHLLRLHYVLEQMRVLPHPLLSLLILCLLLIE